MIDPSKPVRIRDGHGRIRIVGSDGIGNYLVRWHDGKVWRTGRVDENGWMVDGSLLLPPIENYEIDWNRPLAFQDTGERGRMSHFPGTDQRYGVADNEGTLHWYDTSGMPYYRREDGVMEAGRPIMNVDTEYTRKADIRRAEITSQIERDALESNPLYGLF